MSRGLFDDYQIGTAMRNEAVPALEQLAEHEDLRERSLRRFDRDDPPPYASSTEDDYEEEEEEQVPPADEITRILDEPLTDTEFENVAQEVYGNYDAGSRYNLELEFEMERLDYAVRDCTERTRKYFLQYGSAQQGRAGRARLNIMARRNIKRRWEKLGVWNPAWGIPGREDRPLPEDNERAWKWPWQQDDAESDISWRRLVERDPSAMAWTRNPQHPVTRALELRRGMRQTDHSPVIPRSSLSKDVSASQAESFITSRPWFMLEVERKERWERTMRVSMDTWRVHPEPPTATARWMERGDWKEEWPKNYRTRLIGWKWRHESPSPEPEDHHRLDDPTLELTPSEIDALEAVRPPTPPPPLVYYSPPPGYKPGLFGPPLTREEIESRNREPRPPPVRWARLCPDEEDPAVEEALPASPQTSEHQDGEEPAEEALSAPRPARKRRRQEVEVERQPPPPPRQTRKRRSQDEPAEPVEQAPAPVPRQKRQRRSQPEEPASNDPPVRRSARIAARNAAATAATAAPSAVTKRRPPPSRAPEPKPPAQPKGRARKRARR